MLCFFIVFANAFCMNCGVQLSRGANFCGRCGTAQSEPLHREAIERSIEPEIAPSVTPRTIINRWGERDVINVADIQGKVRRPNRGISLRFGSMF